MHLSHDPSGYLSHETIAALATPTGGAIALVRVSGEKALFSIQKLTSLLTQPKPRVLTRCRLYNVHHHLIDDALVALFIAPESYTGENVVEYHIHGNAFIAEQLMESLNHHGIRQALPGEFSFRAVRNGKISLFQAQSISDIITASNSHALTLALEKSSAKNSQLQALKEQLVEIAVLAEIGIDFSDQQLEEKSLTKLKERIEEILKKLAILKESYEKGSKIQDGIKVAFLGLPNAGKSSFFNTLLQEERSIVSELAGTTRDIVSKKMILKKNQNSITLRLEDTAGLRDTLNSIEQIGIQKAKERAYNADFLFFLIDATSCCSKKKAEREKKEWERLAQGHPELEKKTIGIFTKIDLLNNTQREALKNFQSLFSFQNWGFISCLTKEGIPEVIEKIFFFSECFTKREVGEIFLTKLEHSHAIEQSLIHLKRGLLTPEIELFAADIRHTLFTLSPLLGETVTEDLLEKIFSTFCIGK